MLGKDKTKGTPVTIFVNSFVMFLSIMSNSFKGQDDRKLKTSFDYLQSLFTDHHT